MADYRYENGVLIRW